MNLSIRLKKATGTHKPRHHKRRVTFTQPQIIPGGDCCKEDKRKCWLSKQDYEMITLERRYSLRALRKAGFDNAKVDQEEYCSFGLEQMKSVQHLNLVKARQAAVRQAVLAEQKCQKVIGRPDPVAIQMISASFTRDSAEAALERAARYRTDVVNQEKAVPSIESDEESIIPLDSICITPFLAGLQRPRVVSVTALLLNDILVELGALHSRRRALSREYNSDLLGIPVLVGPSGK